MYTLKFKCPAKGKCVVYSYVMDSSLFERNIEYCHKHAIPFTLKYKPK